MINDTPPPISNNNDNTFVDKTNSTKKSNSIGRGSLEKSDEVKYSTAEKNVKYSNKLSVIKPDIEPSKIRQDSNFNESKKIINESQQFFNKIQETAKSFANEVKTGKISEQTREVLNNNINLLQNTEKYMAYLAGHSLANSEAKSVIFTGMGLGVEQQQAAKKLLNGNEALAYVNQKHGGENVAAGKIKALVESGFNKQQAVSILALAKNTNLSPEASQSKMLASLGFNEEQINKLINMNKKSSYPLQQQLLNKMGIDNNTVKTLQAVANSQSLVAQEGMIKSSTPEAIWFLDKTTNKFDSIRKSNFDPKGFNFSLADLFASLAELSRILNKSKLSDRNAKFDMGMAAVDQKNVQADLKREAALQEFTASMIQGAATIVASVVQVKMIAKAPPATVNAVATKANAIGASINAVGSTGAAVMNYEAAQTKADEKESEALEQLYNTYANELGELISSKVSDISKTQSTISDIEKSNANINRTIAGI